MALTVAALLAPHDVGAAAFPTRDQNPLLAGYGIPAPLPARLATQRSWQLAADLNWSNGSLIQSSPNESLLVDAESREVRLTVGRAIGERWMLQLQLPYRYTGAGNLDSFIDGWHDVFGLSKGARKRMPRDQFRIAYERNGTLLFDRRTATSSLADISADLGYGLFSNPDTALAAWLSVKLPTGDAADFTGSGAADVALSVAGEHRFSGRWTVFGQLGVTWLGHGDLLPEQQRSVVWNAMAGASLNLWRGLDAKVQVDVHSAVFDDSQLDFLGQAVILTVGGAYRFQSGWVLDAGVSEDVLVDASPDVVFVLGLRRGFKAISVPAR